MSRASVWIARSRLVRLINKGRAVVNQQDVKRNGWEYGYAGFPSSNNPYPEGAWQHDIWLTAHFEGMCAAIDEGALSPV